MSQPVKSNEPPRRSFTPTSPTHPHTPPTPPPRTVSPGYPYAYLSSGNSPGSSHYYNNNNYNSNGYYSNSNNQGQWVGGGGGYPAAYPPHSPSPPSSMHMMQGGGPPPGHNYYQQYPPNYYNNQNYQQQQQQFYPGHQSPQFPNQYTSNPQFAPRGGHHSNNNNRPHSQKGPYPPNNQNRNNRGGGHNGNNSFNRNNNNNNNNAPGSGGKSKKKNSFDKRDLPENNKFNCEVCDRGFKDEEKYQEHCATHETCGVNGCTFTAATKLVEIHFRNFHATGIDKKVSGLKTPEELEKYINDRKKNFPTKTNLEKKTGFEMEKSSRGVALDTQQFGKLGRNKRPNGFGGGQSLKSREGAAADGGSSSSTGRVNNESKSALKNRKKKNNKKNLFQQKIQVLKSRYNKPTLLQRLLADEIRHERNIILQCVRYVVQNDFFDKKI